MLDQDKSLLRCELCERFSVSGGMYCILHETAKMNVKESFKEWQKAYGNISWERYLERILELVETGDSSKEIARHLLGRKSAVAKKK